MGSNRSARSVVRIVGWCLFDGSWASGTVPAPPPSLGIHCHRPAGRTSTSPLEPAGDGVRALPGAVAALPAQALLLDRGALGLRAEILVRVGDAVGLAER